MKQKFITPYSLLPTCCSQKGFTILELVISIAIIAIMSVAIGMELITYQRVSSLDAAAKDIVSELRSVQNKALSGEDGNSDGTGDAWGVRFSNSTYDTYAEFYGSSFNSANVTGTTTLSSAVVFTNPASSATKDIVFTKITGTTTPSTIILQTQDGSQLKTITVATSSISYY